MEIRIARAEELAEIGRLTGEVYLGAGFVSSADAYVHELADAVRRAREAELWVAVEDGRLLGTVTFCPAGSTYREVSREGEAEFRMLAVAGSARGRGVGRALVEHCLERARHLGYVGVRISTMDRMADAHRIYERLGFTRAPEDDWTPARDVRLLAYRVALSPA